MVEPLGPVLMCGGRQFHVRARDGEGPAVVLMSGCGLAMEYWRPVTDLLPGRRVIAYDRPGLGGTPWPGHLPTLDEEVASLADLLDQLSLGGVTLVAHSMASFHAEALARLRPDLVGALVLVDGSVEWYSSRPDRTWYSVPAKLRAALRAPALSDVGGYVWRLGTWVQSGWELGRLGRGRLGTVYADPDALVMATAESIAYDRQAWDLLRLRPGHPWPGVPTVLVTAGDDADWIASQARYAHLLGARQVVVEGSRHLMMLDCPQVLVDAVAAVEHAAG